MAQLVQFLLLLLLPNTAFAYFGQQGLDTDSSSVISQSTFTSLLNSGYQVFLGVYYNGALVSNPNTYSGIGAGYVSNGVTNIVNARKVFTNTRVVDALHVPKYATPVANVKLYIVNGAFYWGDNIYVQARYAIDQLNSAVSKAHLTAGIGRTWVVISQSANSGWSASTTANQQFFTEFASYFPALGPQLGVVSTQADFQAIFGSTYQPVDGNGNALPLLLADCQAPQDSGSYFTAFNGWSTPTIHRYQCGVSNINGNGITGNLDYY